MSPVDVQFSSAPVGSPGTLVAGMPSPSPLERSPFIAAAQAQDALWAYEKSGDVGDLRRSLQAVIEAVDALAVRQADLPPLPWWRRWWAHRRYAAARWGRSLREGWKNWRHRRAVQRDRVRQVREVLAGTALSAQWDPPHDPKRGGPCWCPPPFAAPFHEAQCHTRRAALGIRPPPTGFWWQRRRKATPP